MLDVRAVDSSLWQRGQPAARHMWGHVATGAQGDTQAWTESPRSAGTGTMGSAGAAPCSAPSPSPSPWGWDFVARRCWTLKERTKRRTGALQSPGNGLSSLCLPPSALLPLNPTAPDINTTLLRTWWKSPRQLLCTLKSWAGELTGFMLFC